MFGVARQGVDIARGVQIGAQQSFVRLSGALWMVRGDINATHGDAPHVPGPDKMAQGSSFVRINGIPVCRASHLAGCGHPTTGADDWFRISD